MTLKALILVGGFGTRLRPLTFTKPKPLVEFANKPILLHQIEALVKVGVKKVILAVNYKPEAMQEQLSAWEEELGIEIVISIENVPLGTAGPLKLAEEHLLDGSNEPFFVLNADVTCEFPFGKLLEFHKSRKAEGTLLATKVTDPSKYGVILSSEEGQIQSFVEKPTSWVGDNINAGLYCLSPEIIKRIDLDLSNPTPVSIEKQVFPQVASAGKLFVMELPGYWADIGQPADYLAGARMHLSSISDKAPERLSTGKGMLDNVLIDPSAEIGKNCVIGPNVVIGPGCKVGDGVRIAGSTLFANSTIHPNAVVLNSIIGWDSSVGRWAHVTGVSVLGEDVHIKEQIVINGVRVLPHKTVGANQLEPTILM